MWCSKNVTCSDPNHTVHYEFEYFDTESCCDGLYVNSVLYQGSRVQTNEWIDSYSPNADLDFFSDSSSVRDGFKMNLKCDISIPEPISDVGNCYFEDFGDSAVFDTGSAYENQMRSGFIFCRTLKTLSTSDFLEKYLEGIL